MTLLCTTTAWAAVLPLPIVRSDAKNDILVSHDLIDNIERDFSRDLGIHMVIHLDPVIVGDARTDALHCKVQSLVCAVIPPSPFTISALSGALRTVISCSMLPCRSR